MSEAPDLPEGWARAAAERIERGPYRVTKGQIHTATGAHPIYRASGPARAFLGAFADPISACQECDRHAGLL